MKKLIFTLLLFVGLSSCETADEEPTMQQLVGEFEMTAELGEHLVNSLSDHMLIFQNWYDKNFVEIYLDGSAPTSYYFDTDGSGVCFYPNNADPSWITKRCRADVEWSYDNVTNSVVINGDSSRQIVYYKHPVLIWKFGSNCYCEFVLEDKTLLEEYMQKYHRSLPIQTVNNEWLSGRVYTFTAYVRDAIPIGTSSTEFTIQTHLTEQQYVYFAEDGTGIAFVKAPAKGDKKFASYQLPISWTLEYNTDVLGRKRYVLRMNDTMYEIVGVFEQYISDQKTMIGLEMNEYNIENKAPDSTVGFFDDYDLDQLKAEYTDPQP